MMIRSLANRKLQTANCAKRSRRLLNLQSLEDRAVPATFTIVGDDDNFGIDPAPGAGKGSLRQAIVDANFNAGPDTIEFDATFFGQQREIFLIANLPILNGDTTFVGTDKANILIDAGGLPIFQATATGVDLIISNISMENGAAIDGGSISIAAGDLELFNVAIDKSTASGHGGAINITNGNLSLRNVLIANTSASGDGGAIRVGTGNVTIANQLASDTVSITKSSADFSGGAIFIGNGNFAMLDTKGQFVIDQTSAVNDGGGIFVGVGDLTAKPSKLASGGQFKISIAEAGMAGGGVYVGKGNLSLDGSFGLVRIESSTAGNRGGGIYANAKDLEARLIKVIVEDCSVTTVDSQGGGIAIDYALNVVFRSLDIRGCTAGEAGGGIVFLDANTTVIDNGTQIRDCSAGNVSFAGRGGGLAVLGSPQLPFGGKFSSMKIINSHIGNCTASSKGGGVYIGVFASDINNFTSGPLEFHNSSILNCSTTSDKFSDIDGGGGIYANHPIVFSNSLLSHCSSASDGGGYFSPTGDLAVTTPATKTSMFGSKISNNSAIRDGGGIFIGETWEIMIQPRLPNTKGVFSELLILDLQRSTVSDNLAGSIGQPGTGGGVHVTTRGDGPFVKFRESTLNNNKATFSGGGAYLDMATELPLNDIARSYEIINTTISNKTASEGGGLRLRNLHNIGNLQFSTITGNHNTVPFMAGGGLYITAENNDGHLPIMNINANVISGNTNENGNDNLLILESLNTTVLLNHNAIGNNSFIAPTNPVINFTSIELESLIYGDHSELLLGPLADNGGPTQTHLPGELSPLIDYIKNDIYDNATDQRGVPRPVDVYGNAYQDIGAVEVYGFSTLSVVNYTINNGETQRSRLTTITIDFAAPVAASLFTHLGVIKLQRTHIPSNGQGVVGTIVQTGAEISSGRIITNVTTGFVTSITLTFEIGPTPPGSFPGVESGSLADGRWQLSIPIANFATPAADSTPSVTPGAKNLFRFFGDIDANGTVDGSDFSFFPPFGTVIGSPFDFDNNGIIDGTDFAEFGARFGYFIPII